MPLTLPNLDDREFADLVAEAKSMIPQLAPSWTDHNPSDPGITLIELFAYICEMLIYHTNRITDANKLVFLGLLMGSKWLEEHSSQEMDQQISTAIAELRLEQRAISNKDFEEYALQADYRVARAYCRSLRNYENPAAGTIYKDTTAHVSLVIVPADKPFDTDLVKNKLAQIVKDFLEPRRLLTTQLHVVPASFLKLGVNLTLTIFDDRKKEDIEIAALTALEIFFHPLTGGADSKGWRLGQSVYLADIYALLDQLAGIDFIKPTSAILALTLDKDATQPPTERVINAEGTTKMVGIKLQENELLQFEKDWSKLTIN